MSAETKGILKRIIALFLAIIVVAWIGLHGSRDRLLKATEMEEEAPEAGTDQDFYTEEEAFPEETVSLVLSPEDGEFSEYGDAVPGEWDAETGYTEEWTEQTAVMDPEYYPDEIAAEAGEGFEDLSGESAEEWPEQELQTFAPDGALICVLAPEGALPQGCSVKADILSSQDAEASVEPMLDSGREVVEMVVYDIVIIGPDGMEIQPERMVHVSISRAPAGEAGQAELFHIEENGAAEKVAEVPVWDTAAFETDSV